MVRPVRVRMVLARRRAARLSAPVRAMLWGICAGVCFGLLNALARVMAQQLDPMQAQFLRYLFGVLVLLPLVVGRGMAGWMPRSMGGHFVRGFVHTVGLVLWFIALPRIPLADMTAIGFTTPIFIMIGAGLFLKEPLRWDRWLAVLLGFAGVLVMIGPQLWVARDGVGAIWHLVMLASAPVFAVSFLLAKSLTRHESTQVIVLWQAIAVTLFSVPLALLNWREPTLVQWMIFAACGLLGTLGHFCITRSMTVVDLSASQSVKFLDLLWAALLGWLMFGDVPTTSVFAGAVIVLGATLWIAQRESRASAAHADERQALKAADPDRSTM